MCTVRTKRDGEGHAISTAPPLPAATDPSAADDLLPSIRRLMTATVGAMRLTTLELQVCALPELALLVRGGPPGEVRELVVWPTLLPPCAWYEGLLLVATAPQADLPRRAAVHDLATLIGELVVADRRRVEAEELASRAIELAGADALTGLGNRRTWRRALDEEAARATRYPRSTSIVVLDLDGLKVINDEQGHAAGDAYLQRAGGAVQAASRSVDVVCRLGGDEFGVLAPETAHDGASRLASRLRAELEKAGVRASLGVATTADGDLEQAWHLADSEMYLHKRRRQPV